MKTNLLGALCFLVSPLLVAPARAQMPDPPGQVALGEKPKYEAYLFAHMMEGDYGHLYYSVSLDVLHWEMLNGGKRVVNRLFFNRDTRQRAQLARIDSRALFITQHRDAL